MEGLFSTQNMQIGEGVENFFSADIDAALLKMQPLLLGACISLYETEREYIPAQAFGEDMRTTWHIASIIISLQGEGGSGFKLKDADYVAKANEMEDRAFAVAATVSDDYRTGGGNDYSDLFTYDAAKEQFLVHYISFGASFRSFSVESINLVPNTGGSYPDYGELARIKLRVARTDDSEKTVYLDILPWSAALYGAIIVRGYVGDDGQAADEWKEANQADSTARDGGLSYVEPITGSRVTLPDIFEGAEQLEMGGQYGMNEVFVLDRMLESQAQVNISVNEISANSLDDVFEWLIFETYHGGFDVRAKTENYLCLYEEAEFFGEVSFRHHYAYLLDNGSCFYVLYNTKNENMKDYGEAIAIEFAAESGEGCLGLMASIRYAPERPIAGVWHEPINDIWLDIPGGALYGLYNGEGHVLQLGACDDFGSETLYYELTGSTSVYIYDSQSLEISGIDGEFAKADSLGIAPSAIKN
jgi:hypothetical protein